MPLLKNIMENKEKAPMRIILGSQSRGRREVMEKMGVPFEVMPADIDEKAIRFEDPRVLTMALAEAKAEALLPRITGGPAVLVTSDQVVAFNGVIREKPVDEAEARSFLRTAHEAPSECVTSVAVTDTATGKRVTGTDIAKVYFKPIPEDAIEAYIKTGDAMTQAGGFDHAHPLISAYVERIDGESESVTGLPKALTERLLKDIQA
jgi:septum formation protein